MIYLLNDRLIHIQWSIFKGTSQVREDFSRALVKVFLIGPDEKYLLNATAQNGTLAMDVPQGLPEGAYSIECIYVKNYENLLPVRGTLTPSGEPVCHRFPWSHPHNPHSIHPHDHRSNDRCLMRSRMDYVFALTSVPSETDGVSSDGEATLRFKSSVASYGYDGLSAYEIAVMRGDFNGSEGEWLDWMASGKIEIDNALSETSENPVENRVMTKEFNKKQNSLVSGKNIKTVNGQSILGEGNISITGEGTAITVENEFGQSTENPGSQKLITQVNESIKTVSNSVNAIADDEDLVLVESENQEEKINKKLKFANKAYNASAFSGMGRAYLRKNITSGKNVLTQAMMNKANTRYVIQYDYDLNGETITVPERCTLDFQGGSLKNGTVSGNNTRISGDKSFFPSTLSFAGTFILPTVYVDWFIPERNYGDYVDEYINKAFDMARLIGASVTFGNKLSQGYFIKSVIEASGVQVYGNNSTLISTNSSIFKFSGGCRISDINLSFYPYQGQTGATDKKVYAISLGEGGAESYDSNISNVSIDGFFYGVVVNKVWNLRMSNIIIRRTRIGIQAYGKSVNNSIVNANIDCQGSGSRCVKFNDEGEHVNDISEGWVIANSVFTSAEIGIEANNMSHVFLSNCIVDLCSGRCMRFTRNCINIKLENNYFACLDSGSYIIEFTGQNVLNDGDDGIMIRGNTIKSYYSSGACSGIIFSDGKYESIVIDSNTITSLNGGMGIYLNNADIDNLNITNDRMKLCKSYYVNNASTVKNLYILNTDNIDNYTYAKIKAGNVSIINVLSSPPSSGTHKQGDIAVRTTVPVNGIYAWVCTTGGTPGSWFPLGTVEQYAGLRKQGTTTERPNMNEWYKGACYFDTTLNKPIWWTGTKWVDSSGNAV